MKHCIHFLLILTVAVTGLVAQNPREATAEQAPDLSALVKALGHRDFAIRERADADLRALGPKVAQDLRAYLNHEDAELRMRVKAILDSWQAPKPSPDAAPEGLRPLQRLSPTPTDDQERPSMPRPGDFDSGAAFREALRQFMDQRRGPENDLGPGLGLGFSFGPGSMNFRSSKTIYRDGVRLSYSQGDNGIVFSVEPRGGEKTTYEAESLESFKTKEAEVYARYQGTGIFEERVFQFDVLRPDSADQDLSDSEKAARRRVERLLDLTQEDPLADFDEQFQEMIRRHRELDRSLRQRLQDLLQRDGVSIEVFPEADQLRRNRSFLRRPDERPRLGLEVSLPPADIAAQIDPQTLGAGGVYVARVEPGSLAAAMGIEAGDLLLRLNTTALNRPQDLIDSFAQIPSGERVAIGLLRGTESHNLAGKKPGERKSDAQGQPKKLEKLKPSEIQIDEAELEKF